MGAWMDATVLDAAGKGVALTAAAATIVAVASLAF